MLLQLQYPVQLEHLKGPEEGMCACPMGVCMLHVP